MDYKIYQLKKLQEFEKICQHLIKQDNQTYLCAIYQTRKGKHKTISGKIFECVPIRNILHKNWTGVWNCAYKKYCSF